MYFNFNLGKFTMKKIWWALTLSETSPFGVGHVLACWINWLNTKAKVGMLKTILIISYGAFWTNPSKCAITPQILLCQENSMHVKQERLGGCLMS
jgi:hypothetical protein